MKVAADHFVMSFYYDDAAGRLEGIPIVSETADSVTIATDHFSSQVLTDAVAQVLKSLSADSRFRPGTDDWEFPNWGSYLSPNGNCQGQSVSAIYYYVTHRMLDSNAPQLNGLFDNNGSPNPKTPNIWQDDSHAYRLASVIQSETQVSWLEHQVRAFDWGIQETDDRLAYLAIAEAIRSTGAPQLLSIARYDATAKKWSGHAIIAYRVDAGTMFVADPNFPGIPGEIKLNGAKFAPYLSGENATATPTPYTDITYSGVDAFIDFGVVAGHWQEMQDGTIGDDVFPKLPIYAGTIVNGTEQWAQLGTTLQASTTELDLTSQPVGGGLRSTSPTASTEYFAIWVGDQREDLGLSAVSLTDPYYGVVFSSTKVLLKPGQNRLGLLELAQSPGANNLQYVDFQWVTVTYAADVKITPNPASGQPDTGIAFTAAVDDAPKSVRWDWDFGDGVKVTDGGATRTKSYATAGTYQVTVTVYDTSGKTPLVLGNGQTTVTVSTGPDYLSILHASKHLNFSLYWFWSNASVPDECDSADSMPLIWDGLSFTGSDWPGPERNYGEGREMTVAGTVSPDGKTITSLQITDINHNYTNSPLTDRTPETCRWTFANIGMTQIGSSNGVPSWVAILSDTANAAAFVNGTVTTSSGHWAIARAPGMPNPSRFDFVP